MDSVEPGTRHIYIIVAYSVISYDIVSLGAPARSAADHTKVKISKERLEGRSRSRGSYLARARTRHRRQRSGSTGNLTGVAVMDFHALVDRARAEFLEMPGLRLTLAQATRLWGLEAAACQEVINALVGSAFLRRTSGGTVVRAGE